MAMLEKGVAPQTLLFIAMSKPSHRNTLTSKSFFLHSNDNAEV